MSDGAEHRQFSGGPARSERLLQLVIDTIPQRVFWKDRDSHYLGCNRSFARDAGLDDPALIVGKTDFELAWKATAHLYVADDRLVMESNTPKIDIEEPMTFPDGRTIWLRTSKVPLRSEGDSVFGILGMYEDVTGQRQAAIDLRDSEERFRATFEQAAVGIAHVATDGRFLRVNQRLCEMVGYSRGELLARTFQDITHPADLEADLENVRRTVSGEIPAYSMEKRYIRKDGTLAWIALTVSLARDAEGRPKYFISVIEDIEPRRRAEAERTRLAEIVEQASEDVIMTDIDGNISYVNPAFERISGYTRGEVQGQNPRFLKSGRRDAKFYAELWRTVTRGGVWSGHFINKRKDGTLFEEEGSIFPVRDVAGRIVSYVAIKRDVTQEVRLKEQLLQAQKMESVGRLAGGIAHDFNNLLTAILGYAELAAGRLKPEDPTRLELSEIDKAAYRAADLTRQLLAFSRKQVLELRVIDLNWVVSDTHKMLERLIGEDIDLVVLLKEHLGSVKADIGQIGQVLLNLAVNSRDAMPKGGKLTIETSEVELDESHSTFHFDVPPGRYVVLAVSDTGTGMDATTLSHVFEPFFTTKEAGRGTGLGLSTVYGVVKQIGGHVTVYSEPGVGTTVKIHLPRVEQAPEKVHASPAHAAPAGGTETVLVVEDEASIRRLTCRQGPIRHGAEALHAALAGAEGPRGTGRSVMRIAHVSDVHVLSRLGAEWRRMFFNKRITGWANVVLRRGRVHRREYLRAVLEEAAARSDHVVVTGDITNMAHESEYREARCLLDEVARRVEVTVVPGNHDIYLPAVGRERRFPLHFAPFVTSELAGSSVRLPAGDYPLVKLRGPAAIIGLSSAIPRPPFVSGGVLGREQIAALERVLALSEVASRTPVLLVHHPPVDVRSRLARLRDGLLDADRLRRVLDRLPRGLVLFGHIHARSRVALRTSAGTLDVVSASGAALDHPDPRVRAGFNLYEIAGDEAVARVESYALDASGTGFSRVPMPARIVS